MPTAEINGITMHYEVYGSGEPLILIMGWIADKEWWPIRLLNYLKKYYQVILFDNRGSGRSGSSEGKYSIKLFADDVIELMNFLKLDKVNIFGISMGGMIAQELVINYPDRINKVILGCTTCGFKYGKMISLSTIYHSIIYGFKVKYNFTKIVVGLLLSRTYLNDNDIILIENFKKSPNRKIDRLKQFLAILDFNSYHRLEKITNSTLIITGTKDLLIHHSNSELLVNKICNSTLCKMKGLSHAFVDDDPASVFLMIYEFLNEKKII